MSCLNWQQENKPKSECFCSILRKWSALCYILQAPHGTLQVITFPSVSEHTAGFGPLHLIFGLFLPQELLLNLSALYHLPVVLRIQT